VLMNRACSWASNPPLAPMLASASGGLALTQRSLPCSSQSDRLCLLMVSTYLIIATLSFDA
jgi:hypothetical protein